MVGKGLDCLFPYYIPVDKDKKQFLRVRCGKCFNCRRAHAREWSLRLACESKLWTHSCFVTLTYDPKYVPTVYVGPGLIGEDAQELLTLNRRDIQLFLKRLRKNLGFPIRFYCASEYGGKTHRPHYHLIIFGIDESFANIINDCWRLGFIDVGDVQDGSINYVASYCEKKIFLDENNPFVVREGLQCSQHLGEEYFFSEFVDKGKIDAEHQSVRYGEFFYPIPRPFRKKMIEQGLLPKVDQVFFAEKQRHDYYLLCKDLQNKGLDTRDFFRARTVSAVSSHFSRQSARDKI